MFLLWWFFVFHRLQKPLTALLQLNMLLLWHLLKENLFIAHQYVVTMLLILQYVVTMVLTILTCTDYRGQKTGFSRFLDFSALVYILWVCSILFLCFFTIIYNCLWMKWFRFFNMVISWVITDGKSHGPFHVKSFTVLQWKI